MKWKKWEVLSPVEGNNLNLDQIISILLKNREIKGQSQQDSFFNPQHPWDLSLEKLKLSSTEVKKAVLRIKKAIEQKEKILIYGDYDADGVCATAILYQGLINLGTNITAYLPDRFSEGYGINSKSLKKIQEKQPDLGLIITVDNGIVAHQAADFLQKSGIDLIITDHHQADDHLPSALAVLHTTEISGSAVAWVLVRELFKSGLGGSINEEMKNQGLDLVALGTVADVLALIGLNRSFVKHGFSALTKTERPGLQSLFTQAGIDQKSLDTYKIGFMIAPRINAMGRLKHAMDSFQLLVAEDLEKAKLLAEQTGRINQERQKLVQEVVSQARETARKKEWPGVILVAGEAYHEGVIGLAAAKLVEEFYRPAIVVSKNGELAKASARSIPGFDMIEAIKKIDHLLEERGGHPMAAGFSLKTKNLKQFLKELDQISQPLLTEEILARKLKIDLELGFNQLNWDLLKRISGFEPLGVGNPHPTFVTREIEAVDFRTVGQQNKHLKLRLRGNDRILEAIAFNFGYLLPNFYRNQIVDLAYSLEENIWNGQKSLQLKVKDLRFSQKT